VAIVTGGADGLGKGITDRLCSEGCKVVIVDFNESKVCDATWPPYARAARVQSSCCTKNYGRSSLNGCQLTTHVAREMLAVFR
jgi:NAD(P)-dependent dehydrogenase (short-subunit alcohol dehydrogenase family)